MQILITGIGGLIGSRLARYILQETDATIIGVDDFSCGYRENVPTGQRIHVYEYSLGDKHDGFLDRLFRRFRFDYVFHLAAYAAEGLSPFIRAYNYRNNLLASVDVINACLNTPPHRLVFTSSMAVYGRQPTPYGEELAPAPIDPYGIAKAAVEADIRIAGEQHGLQWSIIRPHNVYGINQDLWTPYRNVLGIWMARTLQGLPMRIYGDGQQKRAFSQVEDCVPCLWRAATDKFAIGKIINLGGTRPITIADAAEMLIGIMGRGEVEYCVPRHEVREAWSTWAKSETLLGYRDETPLAEGLAAMWAWARHAWAEYPDRRHKADFTYEVKSGLYPYWDDPKRAA